MVLQCPWKKGNLKNGWNPRVWRKELHSSQTGRRLGEALPQDTFKIRVCNANPRLGDHSGASFPADLSHLHRTIRRVKPDLILACGSISQSALKELRPAVSVVAMPHPTYRGLSKEKTRRVRAQLKKLANGL